jgi:hypothetical protein
MCTWFKLSPIGGATVRARRELFNKFTDELKAGEYIIIHDVPLGKQAELTDKGKLVIKEVSNFLDEYINSICTQFNLIPVI